MKHILLYILICFSVYSYAQDTIRIRTHTRITSALIKFGMDNKRLFIIDSGSQYSYISKQYLEISHIDLSKFKTSFTEIVTLSESATKVYGEVRIKVEGKEMKMRILDMTNINAPLSGFEYYGILGTDWLKSRKACLDYKDGVLTTSN